ncbi:MAG: hypothetical protein NZ585_12730 [Chloracidobacterium sp.]|nr:hypothetical protein [Chloracidobacterium sp.]MDW8217848.1 hypothetical protein [Acidobacteriota bacterium]
MTLPGSVAAGDVGGIEDALPALQSVWLDAQGRLLPERLLER